MDWATRPSAPCVSLGVKLPSVLTVPGSAVSAPLYDRLTAPAFPPPPPKPPTPAETEKIELEVDGLVNTSEPETLVPPTPPPPPKLWAIRPVERSPMVLTDPTTSRLTG